jgi:hypothetical protein
MVHRGIATLAGLLAFCFLTLSALEPPFFLLHMYQSLIYLVIILMLFYLEDHWAYMLGILAPAAWLVISLLTGVLQSSMRSWFNLPELVRFRGAGTAISLMGLIVAVISVLMIGFCIRHWRREFAGTGRFAVTFGFSLVIVAVYYAILAAWFTRLIPAG